MDYMLNSIHICFHTIYDVVTIPIKNCLAFVNQQQRSQPFFGECRAVVARIRLQWKRRTQMSPMLAPWTLLSGTLHCFDSLKYFLTYVISMLRYGIAHKITVRDANV